MQKMPANFYSIQTEICVYFVTNLTYSAKKFRVYQNNSTQFSHHTYIVTKLLSLLFIILHINEIKIETVCKLTYIDKLKRDEAKVSLSLRRFIK